MPTDVGGLDPLSVSLRDYVDGMQLQRDQAVNEHEGRHSRDQDVHEHRHDRDHISHQAVHDMEKDALISLATLVAAQRAEDAATVDRALTAVEKASQVHALAHEQQQAAHQQTHDIEKDAIEKAASQMDQRLISMNAFRDQLREQSANFIGSEVFHARMLAIERERDEYRTRLTEVTTRVTSLEVGLATKAQAGDTTGRYALAIIGFAITFVVTAVVVIANIITTQ